MLPWSDLSSSSLSVEPIKDFKTNPAKLFSKLCDFYYQSSEIDGKNTQKEA